MAISSRAIKAGEAFVSMMLDDKQFSDSIDQWKEKFSQLEKRIAPLGQALAGAGATLSAPFALGFRHLLTYTKQLDFTAKRLGLTADEMSRLAAVAQMTDVSVEGLEIGMKTIGERIMQLQSSSQETAMAFQQLGIDAQQFINEPNTLRRLFMISEAFTKIEDAGLQAGLSLRALGESGNRMLILLRKGPEQLRKEMEGFADIVADDSQMRAANQLFEGWTKLKLAAGNLAGEMAETLVPTLSVALEQMTALAAEFTKVVKAFPNMTAMIGGLSFGAMALGTMVLSLKAVSFMAFKATAAMKGLFDVTIFGFNQLIPLLIQTEMHISGVGASLTPLAAGLGFVAAALAAVLVPLKLLTGMTWAETIKSGLMIVNERLLTFISNLSFLPEIIRKTARFAAAWTQHVMFGTEPTNRAVKPAPSVLGPMTTPMNTSGIAARFASQQTMGASGTTSAADQTANNTARMADTLDRMEVRQRETGRL